MIRLSDVIDAQLYLFGQYGIPEHQKEASRFVGLKGLPNFGTIFHEARTAPYCGLEKSNFHSDVAIKRGLDNFEIGLELLLNREVGRVGGARLKFELKPKMEDMPEALWYCSIAADTEIAARIGLNLHYEKGLVVATIANIQGKSKRGLDILKEKLTPNHYWAVEAVSSLLAALNSNISIVRGIASTSHPSRFREGFDRHRASCLYDRTFQNKSVGMSPIRGTDGSVMYYEIKRWTRDSF